MGSVYELMKGADCRANNYADVQHDQGVRTYLRPHHLSHADHAMLNGMKQGPGMNVDMPAGNV